MFITLIYIAIGISAGLLAGLFGTGGSVIMVPALLIVFTHLLGIKTAAMHLAASTSLATVTFVSANASFAHWRHDHIEWKLIKPILPGALLGGFIGSHLAKHLHTSVLSLFFGCFLFIIAVQMSWPKNKNKEPQQNFPTPLGLGLIGLASGSIASLLGIGGSTLLVPIFSRCGLPMRQSAGTAVAITFFIALTATLNLAIYQHPHDLPIATTGYVYWPAALIMAGASLLSVPVGTYLIRVVNNELLQYMLGLLLVVISLHILWPIVQPWLQANLHASLSQH